MKTMLLLLFLPYVMILHASAQSKTNDESLRYQQQRMVYQQWDQNKFTPKKGFLSLNPYYWLTWGFFYPNYHKTDLRPLSATGPQTQRLALAGTMSNIDGKYKLQSDTVRNTALSEIANHSGAISAADPLWLLYYRKQFKPLLNYDYAAVIADVPTGLLQQLISDGLINWYNDALLRLKERVEAAHTADMDRGSRIMAYFRLLREYKQLNGVWNIRLASLAATVRMNNIQQNLKGNNIDVPAWTPQSDILIAKKVLTHIQ